MERKLLKAQSKTTQIYYVVMDDQSYVGVKLFLAAPCNALAT
jgi:hypothetical protein